MEDDVLIRGILGVSVPFPISDVLIDLNVSGSLHPVDEHLSVAKVRTRFAIPSSEVDNLHVFSVFSSPREIKLAAKNSRLQLKLGNSAGQWFAEAEPAEGRPKSLVGKFLREFHLNAALKGIFS
jgi:hypothetical protein